MCVFFHAMGTNLRNQYHSRLFVPLKALKGCHSFRQSFYYCLWHSENLNLIIFSNFSHNINPLFLNVRIINLWIIFTMYFWKYFIISILSSFSYLKKNYASRSFGLDSRKRYLTSHYSFSSNNKRKTHKYH